MPIAVSCNVARFDLVSIRLAVLCAEHGSLSAAAKQVPCSLSAASSRLNGLEHAVGTALFIREHSGLRLTPAGDEFIAHGKAILKQVELMHSTLQYARGR